MLQVVFFRGNLAETYTTDSVIFDLVSTQVKFQ